MNKSYKVKEASFIGSVPFWIIILCSSMATAIIITLICRLKQLKNQNDEIVAKVTRLDQDSSSI